MDCLSFEAKGEDSNTVFEEVALTEDWYDCKFFSSSSLIIRAFVLSASSVADWSLCPSWIVDICLSACPCFSHFPVDEKQDSEVSVTEIETRFVKVDKLPKLKADDEDADGDDGKGKKGGKGGKKK